MALEYQVKYTTFRRLWFRCAKEVLDNRPSQHPRLMGIDEQHRPELFVVDIWKGYISAIREVCPSAVIIKELLRQCYGLKDYDEACSLLRWWCRNAFYCGLPGFKAGFSNVTLNLIQDRSA